MLSYRKILSESAKPLWHQDQVKLRQILYTLYCVYSCVLAKPEIKPRKYSKGADIAESKINVIASKTITEAKATCEDEVCTHNISVINLTKIIN